jgi:enamine deaminase RidA (YjgF/YER057c/UK114 family)
MAGTIDARLAELGITLPEAAAPAANYVPYVQSGKLLFISGQLPFAGGELVNPGTVGSDVTVEQAQEAARQVALNIIAQAKAACGGDLDKVVRCVKLGGFVACADGFTQQPQVVNGCSDTMVEVFGDKGRHARFAVGTNALPLGTCVEIDAIFEVE